MPDADQPSGSPKPWRRPDFLIATAVAVVVGVIVGRGVAYWLTRPGSMNTVSAGLLIVLTIIGVVVVSSIWLAAVRVLGRDGRAARRSIALATAVLVACTVGAYATAGFTGGTYVEPVVLSATGTTRSTLTGAGMAPAIKDGGAATCDSEPDTRIVSSVMASDLGAFGTGRLRGFLMFSPDGSVDGWALIDGSDGNPERLPIQWAGTLRVADLSADRTSGRVTFPDVPLGEDAKLPGDSIAPEWPRTLSGEISWECGPWAE
ncbi:MAG: hypothetical protein ABIZ52_06985 [Candidatus Limnocylindrales bacterium]